MAQLSQDDVGLSLCARRGIAAMLRSLAVATEAARRAVLINGVAGVGKSTVADAIGGLLTAARHPTAVVDLDALSQFGPPPPGGSGFYDELRYANLAAVWSTYRGAGAQFLVVSGGIDSRTTRQRYAETLADCELRMLRLVAPLDVIRDRLRGRERGATLDRHLRRLADDHAFLEAADIEDFTVRADGPPDRVALEVVTRLGWASIHREESHQT